MWRRWCIRRRLAPKSKQWQTENKVKCILADDDIHHKELPHQVQKTGAMRAERAILTSLRSVSSLMKDLHRDISSLDVRAMHCFLSAHRVLLPPELDDAFDFVLVLLTASVPCSGDASVVDGTIGSEEIVKVGCRRHERVKKLPRELADEAREGTGGRQTGWGRFWGVGK